MRVSQEAYYRGALADLLRQQANQVATQKTITTNRRVNAPSDGRETSYTILSSQQALSIAEQYQTNLSQAQSWMKASDTAMQSLSDLLKRAKVLAAQMATGTYQSADQLTTASEVKNIIDEIIKTANSQTQGFYLFSGTRTTTPAFNASLVSSDPSSLADASTVGHGARASIYQSGGNYYLRLGRDSNGATTTITVPNNAASNTLGAGLGIEAGAGFDTWGHTQSADANNPDIWTSADALASATANVSNRVGEVLNFDGAAGAGTQTYRTAGLVSFTGGGAGAAQVTIGVDTYTVAGATAAASAANLVEQINANPARGYYAWTDSAGSVRVMSKNAVTYAMTETADPGLVMTVNPNTTLQQIVNQINSGMQAQGSVHLDGSLPGNLPIATDTISLGASTWNWGQISPAQVSFSGGAAGVAQVNVGGTVYTVSGSDAATSAQNLASQVNAGGTLYAQVVGGNQVVIHSKAGGAFLSAAIVADPNTVMAATSAPPATAAGFAQNLADFINANTGNYGATVTSDGSGATVQVAARATGMAYNVALTSSNALVGTSGSLLGGINGEDTQGKLYLSGTSSMRLATTVRAQVSAVDATTGAVSLHLSWYDDAGAAQAADVVLPATGDNNAVNVPGLGGLSLYRDGLGFKVGSVMTLQTSYYQGNQQEIGVNFFTSQHLSFTWNGAQVLGGAMTSNLDGQVFRAGQTNTGSGQVQLSGAYRGILDRDLTINVVDAGQVPSDQVTLRVRWTGDDGVAHQQDVTMSASGSGGKVQLPGGDGIYLQVDNGTFNAGDSFTYHLEKNPVQVLDSLKQWLYQLQNGTHDAAQTQSQYTLQSLGQALANLTDFQADNGTRQDRITVRSGVLDDAKLSQSKNLADLQDVDLTQAFVELQRQQSTYQSTLKVVSTMSELSLLKFL